MMMAELVAVSLTASMFSAGAAAVEAVQGDVAAVPFLAISLVSAWLFVRGMRSLVIVRNEIVIDNASDLGWLNKELARRAIARSEVGETWVKGI